MMLPKCMEALADRKRRWEGDDNNNDCGRPTGTGGGRRPRRQYGCHIGGGWSTGDEPSDVRGRVRRCG